MVDYIKVRLDVFLRYRYLLMNLVNRDIKVKYRRSALGFLWSFLNPLLMMLVLTLVFSTMFKQNIENFPLYLLTGQLMFGFFSEGTSMAMESVLGNAALVKKVYIPKYIFPFAKVTFSLVNMGFSLVSMLLVMIVTRVPVTPWVLLAPVPILLLFVFNLGVGMALASLVIFFRDIKHLYGILLLTINYLTPIFYPVELLPEYMQFVVRLNPLFWYVGMFRQLVLAGAAPTLLQWVGTVLSAVVALMVGFTIFKRTQDRFILFI